MQVFLVSRHPASVEWIEQSGLKVDESLTHLDAEVLSRLKAGDIVVGNLPIQLVAQITSLGAHYYHLEVDIPFEWRGKELSAQQLTAFGAKLTEYQAKKIKEIV